MLEHQMFLGSDCLHFAKRKGQVEVTPRPRRHLMGVTLGLAELRLHCLQSTYHMEGRAACQNTDTGTKQRIIAINPTQRAETEMSVHIII